MANPDWFLLVQQWRERGMGEYGISLPFLIGALTHRSGVKVPGENEIRNVVREMIEKPVPGFVIEIRWCAGISAPVLSAAKAESSRMPYKSFFARPEAGGASIAFSQDVQSMFALNCQKGVSILVR